MPRGKNEEKNIAEMKDKYVEFLRELPVHKFASMHVGRDQDTTLRWRNEDPVFAERCEEAISSFAKKTYRRTKPEFQLERAFPQDFAPLQKLGNPDGSPLQFVVTRGDTTTYNVKDKKE